MYNPQEAVKDFEAGKYALKNKALLEPAYAVLFKDMYAPLNLGGGIQKDVNELYKFFDQIEGLVAKNDVLATYDKNPEEALNKLKGELPEDEVNLAVGAFVNIIKFIAEERSNVNGLEAILWTLFNETSREGLISDYKDNPQLIQEQLLGRSFLALVIFNPTFAKIALQNVLMPVELKNPSRRQGNFDAIVLRTLMQDLKQFTYEPKRTTDYLQTLKEKTNWGISEDSVKHLGLPIPARGKIPDMVIKIGDALIVGAHKEQTFGGGGQDNQAEDAGRIFQFTEEQERAYREKLNVKKLFFCIVLDLQFASLSGKHWSSLVEIVKDKNNQNKYLISSYQLKLLVESLLP